MATYERGDYVRVDFPGEAGMPSEWMWVRVHHRDDDKQLVFGTLDNEPVNDYDGKLNVGSEVAVAYSQIREHKKRLRDSPHAYTITYGLLAREMDMPNPRNFNHVWEKVNEI